MVEFDRSAFIGKFQEEATDLLQRLNEGVITLEGEPENRGLIEQMLRDAHTLKGSSRMVGLMDISDIAHRLEDIMVRIRDKQMDYTSEMSDSVFEALDAIVFLTENAGGNEGGRIDLEALQSKLSELAAGGGTVSTAPTDETVRTRPAVEEGIPTAPGAPANARTEAKESDTHAVSDATSEVVPDEIDESGGAGQGPQSVSREDALKSKSQPTIRIRTEQIDLLLNLVSEVVISQIKAEQRVMELRTALMEMTDIWESWTRMKSVLAEITIADDAAYCAVVDELTILDSLLSERRRSLVGFTKGYTDDISRTTMVVADLQETGMRLRMLPANTVFNAFPRAVRDLARSFKKEIELVIEGGETELDKKILEEINDPLIHIMRNAVDHGIESPEERLKAGKPAAGMVSLSARQEGDHIVVEVADDGRGIDPGKVRAAAVRKGFISQHEADAMSDREATYLIFEAGFSTSPIITEISGRGVGMDVVREFIVEKLKGSLDVRSELGHGTTFRLTMPLTLAIIRALMLGVGGRLFALPTASVEETLRVDREEILKVEGREVIRRQRRTIPLVRLADLLNVPGSPVEVGKIPIVVVGFSGHRMGFLVDTFHGEQQIVIKTLGTHLRKVENVAGVTVLGAGEVVPILNVPDLMHNARVIAGGISRGAKEEEHAGPRRILICEDSFTTRELERSIFEAAGYEVEVAVDGAMGFSRLKEGPQVDAVVTDVQMPNMTGFELTRAIKTDAALQHVPVVIVTSLERDEEKAEGIDAGADAYITKSVFNQDTLLDTVERLIR